VCSRSGALCGVQSSPGVRVFWQVFTPYGGRPPARPSPSFSSWFVSLLLLILILLLLPSPSLNCLRFAQVLTRAEHRYPEHSGLPRQFSLSQPLWPHSPH